mgnify:FL=1
MSQSAKDKISKYHKGKVISEQTRKRLSNSRIGRFNKEESPRAKITMEIAEKIREKYKTGAYTQAKLASEFEISQQTVSLVVNKLNW